MAFRDDLPRDFKEVFLNPDEFAVTAVYTHDGNDSEVNVLYSLVEDPDGYVVAGTRTAYIQAGADDVPDLAAGDTFAIDGHLWHVSTWEIRGCVVDIVAGGGS